MRRCDLTALVLGALLASSCSSAPAADRDPRVALVRRTFARLGWAWGGSYTDPDYQHFSAP